MAEEVRTSNVKYVGEIPVFPFIECTPDEMRAHPEDDMFMVYHSDGDPLVCVWKEGAFWYAYDAYRGSDANWQVVLNVEFWFRIPELKEIVSEQVQAEPPAKGV